MDKYSFFLPKPGHSFCPFIEQMIELDFSISDSVEFSDVDSIVSSIYSFNNEWRCALFYSLADRYAIDLNELLIDYEDVPYLVVNRNGYQRYVYVESGLAAIPSYRYFQSLFNRIVRL